MGMQSLRFAKPSLAEDETASRPPAMLTFGICLLAGATIAAIMLGAVQFGLIDALSSLLE